MFILNPIKFLDLNSSLQEIQRTGEQVTHHPKETIRQITLIARLLIRLPRTLQKVKVMGLKKQTNKHGSGSKFFPWEYF